MNSAGEAPHSSAPERAANAEAVAVSDGAQPRSGATGGRWETVAVVLTGRDRVSLVHELTRCASAAGADVLDVQQTIVQKTLNLAIIVRLDTANERSDRLYREVLLFAKRFGVHVDFNVNTKPAATPRHAYALTVLSSSIIAPSALHELSVLLANKSFIVEKVMKLSQHSFRCLEFGISSETELSRHSLKQLRKDLYQFGRERKIDIAMQAENVSRRSRRLVVMDMDSTLIQQEVIDELARYAGVYEQVQRITHRAMAGELDFNESLRQRVGLLRGTPASTFQKVIDNLQYTEGAQYLCRSLKNLGYRLAVISGGFTAVTEHVRRHLSFDYDYANQLEVGADGCFTGRTIGPIVNAQRKADLLSTIAQLEGITLDQTIAIGDGANDLKMLAIAGLGIAFNAKPAVQDLANFRINQKNLDSVLYLLGFSEEDQMELRGKVELSPTLEPKPMPMPNGGGLLT